MAVKGFEKQNAVKKKQQQKSRTSVQKISDADQAFILTMGEAFTKTDFCQAPPPPPLSRNVRHHACRGQNRL